MGATKEASLQELIEREIAELKETKDRARRAVPDAEEGLESIRRRRDELSLELFADNPEARAEDAELEERSVREAGRLRVARSAAEEANKRLSEARARLAEQRRRDGLERARELAGEAAAQVQRAEELIEKLGDTIGELLASLNRRQHALSVANDGDTPSLVDPVRTMTPWVAARLSEQGDLLRGEIPFDDRVSQTHLGHLLGVGVPRVDAKKSASSGLAGRRGQGVT